MKQQQSPSFSKSAVALLIASAAVLFALGILLTAFGESSGAGSGNKAGPGTFSVSAVGHAGLYDVLKRLGRPVRRGMGESIWNSGSGASLIMIEPDLGLIGRGQYQNLNSAKRMLLVLPKWHGVKSGTRPAWVERVYPVHFASADRTLELVDESGAVGLAAWPERWPINEIGYEPAGFGLVQLIRSKNMRPVVADERGILVGEIEKDGRKILVLSDPDVAANHGLVKGDNAAFMVALIDGLRSWQADGNTSSIIFDEAPHGYSRKTGSPLKLLFMFPFAVVTALLCAAAALLVWAGAGRFGAPLTPRPPIDFGKATLIANGARLLDQAGRHTEALKRYVRMTIRSAAAALHAPAGLDDQGRAEWLDRIGRARGIERSSLSILNDVDRFNPGDEKKLARLYENVWAIYRWKGEMLNEHSARRRHS